MTKRTQYYTTSQLRGTGAMTKKEIKNQLVTYFGWNPLASLTFDRDLSGVLVSQMDDCGGVE